MNKTNILFYPTNNGDYLRMQVRHNGEKIGFNVGYRIDRSKWSAETQRCKKNTTHFGVFAVDINARIEEYETIIYNIIKQSPQATKNEIRTAFNVAIGKERSKDTNSLDFLVDKFIGETNDLRSWSANTYKKWKTIGERIKRLGTIENITSDTITGYVRELIKTDHINTSIEREISYVFTFLRWCKINGFYSGNVHETFNRRMKKADNDIVFLSWSELQKIYNFDFRSDHLNQVRDVFCFLCFSGLRFSDAKKLQKSDVYNGKIHVTTQKTSETIAIELNQYTTAILDKYKDFPTDYALPCISNQKTNEALKEIGQIAELNEPVRRVWYVGGERKEKIYKKYELLTTHCGRRSFVVNALYLGIPERVVRSWTGHADAKSLNPYVKIVDELKQKEMSKFNEMPSVLPSK